MAEINKVEQHVNQWTIYLSRTEGGLQSLRSWLFDRQAEINKLWPEQVDEDLIRLQGAAKEIAKIIKLIDNQPTVKRI